MLGLCQGLAAHLPFRARYSSSKYPLARIRRSIWSQIRKRTPWIFALGGMALWTQLGAAGDHGFKYVQVASAATDVSRKISFDRRWVGIRLLLQQRNR